MLRYVGVILLLLPAIAYAQSPPTPLVGGALPPPALRCNGNGPNGSGCQIGPAELSIRGHLNLGHTQNGPTYGSGGGGSATFDTYATDSRFQITTSGSASTSVVVNFAASPNAWQAAPACFVNPEQNSTTAIFAIATTAHVTISWSGSVASAIFDVFCVGTRSPTSG